MVRTGNLMQRRGCAIGNEMTREIEMHAQHECRNGEEEQEVKPPGNTFGNHEAGSSSDKPQNRQRMRQPNQRKECERNEALRRTAPPKNRQRKE